MNYWKYLASLILVFNMHTVSGQVTSVNYQLEYIQSSSLYNFNLIINAGSATDYPQRIQFNAQYSLIFPDNLNFTLVESFMPLEDNQNYMSTTPITYIESVTADSMGFTYLAIAPTLTPTAAYNNLAVGDTIPLFSFDVGGYDPNVRLFENGVDTPPEMNSYLQGFTLGGISQLYSGNSPTAGIPDFPTLEITPDYASLNRPLYIGSQSKSPNGSALLDLESTEKGFLPPRMTNEEITSIENPEQGLIVYSLTENMPVFYTGSFWLRSDGQALEAQIGSFAHGGVVVHVSEAGEVLVLDTSLVLNPVSAPWGCEGTDIPSTEALNGPFDLGKNKYNYDINRMQCTRTAAQIVDALTVMQDGMTYDDWHLASAQDYLLIKALDLPVDENYWIAHQFDNQEAVSAVSSVFGSITPATNLKTFETKVYAVRTFILD